MSLGNRIRAARERLKMTQAQLGDQLGVTGSAISDFERGGSQPEIHRISTLASTLHVPVKWLLDGHGEPPPETDLELLLDRLGPAQRQHAIRYLKMLASDSEEVA